MPERSPLMFHRSGSSHRVLARWEPVLLQMHAAIERYRECTDEVPWQWGERSLVSFLTAAVWLRGGVALEEFATLKKDPADRRQRVNGRADLWADLDGTSFSIEAKVVASSLGRRGAADTRLLAAISDAQHTTEYYAHHRIAVLFVEWTGQLADGSDGTAESEAWFAEVAASAAEKGSSATLCAVHLARDPVQINGWGYGIALALF